MLFKQGAPLYAFEINREAGQDVLYVNYLGAPYVPSLADSEEVFARTVEIMLRNPNISRIVFVQQRNYSYNFEQTMYMAETAQLYNYLLKQENILSANHIVYSCPECGEDARKFLSYFVLALKQDPVAAYVLAEKKLGELNLERISEEHKSHRMAFVILLEKISAMFNEMKVIKNAKKYLEGYALFDRGIYSYLFRPDVIPNFAFTRLVAELPEDATIVSQYELVSEYEKTSVTLLKRERDAKYFYHIMPPEYSLSEEHQHLLNLARNVLIEHRPQAEQYTDPERTRNVFFNISLDLLRELAANSGVEMGYKQLNLLAAILVRHTIGFGLVEILLQDAKLQDIVVNAPIGIGNVFVRHQDYDECVTNVMPSPEDADSWATKFRLISGRPLDEANPVLDTDLVVGKARARVAIVQRPLSSGGLAYAFRRHRESPWTLPLFIKNKMINSFTAGLMSFLIDGSRTMLIAGTRSSGKTSFLGSLLMEIMPKFRVLVVEDTPELPIASLKESGYDILGMKVRSALLKTTTELEASEGIRTALRLGDSSLIIGEVRSEEAKALFEAMRIGALANVVAGTIHGASPYGVFDRVVNDLGVPATSFKATDIIVVANPIKTADGLHSMKRVVQVTEVRKQWTKDPLEEKGFVDLLVYNVEKDELEPTPELINGESEVIKAIAGNVKGWAGNWDAVFDNIILRGKIKQEIVDMAERFNRPDMLEYKFNVLSNNAFHAISDKVRQEVGLPVSTRVFPEWRKWALREIERTKG